MKERREFLKAASLLPLVASDSLATAAEQRPTTAPSGTPAGAPSQDKDSSDIPRSAPVGELPFPDYQLLGNPDPDGHLFTGARPRDWQTTKQQLVAEFQASARSDDPIHAWLRTFLPTFDDRATGIVLGVVSTLPPGAAQLRYEPQLYDAWLRAASALLDRCLRYRNEMGNFEMSGINAGIGYLTFLKTKPIQRNIIIQSSGADLDAIEEWAQSHAGERYHKARGLDKLFDKYHLEGLSFEATGGAAEAGLSGNKDRLRTRLLERQFNIQSDAQLAAFTRLLTSGSSSNFAERFLRLYALLVEDLADAYRKLYSASKGIQQVLGISMITPGSAPATSVDIPAFTDANAVRTWVQQMIPPQDGNQRKPDVLDAMVIWTRAVMREIDTRGQYETEFTVSIPLCQPWGRTGKILVTNDKILTAFAGTNPTGQVGFTLTPDADALPYPATLVPGNIRILGIGLSLEHDNDDASPPQYDAAYTATTTAYPNPTDPQKGIVRAIEQIKMARFNAWVKTPQQIVNGVTYSRPTVYLSNLRLQGGTGGDSEAALSFDPGCRNLGPFGAWTINFDLNMMEFFNSLSPITIKYLFNMKPIINGLILHLRLRGTARTQ